MAEIKINEILCHRGNFFGTDWGDCPVSLMVDLDEYCPMQFKCWEVKNKIESIEWLIKNQIIE